MGYISQGFCSLVWKLQLFANEQREGSDWWKQVNTLTNTSYSPIDCFGVSSKWPYDKDRVWVNTTQPANREVLNIYSQYGSKPIER